MVMVTVAPKGEEGWGVVFSCGLWVGREVLCLFEKVRGAVVVGGWGRLWFSLGGRCGFGEGVRGDG